MLFHYRSNYTWLFFLLLGIFFLRTSVSLRTNEKSCDELLVGQFECDFLNIDPETQELRNCSQNGKTSVNCTTLPGISCVYNERTLNGSVANHFTKLVDCRWTNKTHYSTAVILSIFLGWLGVDRLLNPDTLCIVCIVFFCQKYSLDIFLSFYLMLFCNL